MVDGERMIGGIFVYYILAPGAKISNGCNKVLSKHHLMSNVLHFILSLSLSLTHTHTFLHVLSTYSLITLLIPK